MERLRRGAVWCEASCCTARQGLGVLRSCAHIVAARAVANLAAGGISVGTYPRPEMSTAHLPRHCVLTALLSHGPFSKPAPSPRVP